MILELSGQKCHLQISQPKLVYFHTLPKQCFSTNSQHSKYEKCILTLKCLTKKAEIGFCKAVLMYFLVRVLPGNAESLVQ